MAETWVFNNTLQIIKELSSSGEFTSNGETFSLMKTTTDGRLRFYAASGNYIDVYANNAWEAGIGDYKTVAFSEAPEKNFRSWLESNATLQEDTTVVEYLTTNIDLKKVANAIRAKGGTTAKLSFPDGFAQAINNISTGTGSGKEEEVVTVPLNMANGDQIVTPSEGKTLSQVTITKPDDLLPSRVVLGSNIGGVAGNYFAPEIWVLNEEIVAPTKTLKFTDLAFLTCAANNENPDEPFAIQTTLIVVPRAGKVMISAVDATGTYRVILKQTAAMSSGHYTDTNGWYGGPAHPQIGRVMVFLQPTSTTGVQSWLRENAVLYGGDTGIERKRGLFALGDVDFAKVLNVTANGAYSIKPNAPYSTFGSATVNVNVPVPSVQDTKALTITSNGTVSVTPDAPYDALKKVDVQTNIDPYNTEMAETVTCLGTVCSIYGVYFMGGNDGNKVIAPCSYPASQSPGAKILKNSHITFPSTSGGFPIYWTPSDALSVVSNAIYYPSGSKDNGFYVCKVVKDFSLLMDD